MTSERSDSVKVIEEDETALRDYARQISKGEPKRLPSFFDEAKDGVKLGPSLRSTSKTFKRTSADAKHGPVDGFNNLQQNPHRDSQSDFSSDDKPLNRQITNSINVNNQNNAQDPLETYVDGSHYSTQKSLQFVEKDLERNLLKRQHDVESALKKVENMVQAEPTFILRKDSLPETLQAEILGDKAGISYESGDDSSSNRQSSQISLDVQPSFQAEAQPPTSEQHTSPQTTKISNTIGSLEAQTSASLMENPSFKKRSKFKLAKKLHCERLSLANLTSQKNKVTQNEKPSLRKGDTVIRMNSQNIKENEETMRKILSTSMYKKLTSKQELSSEKSTTYEDSNKDHITLRGDSNDESIPNAVRELLDKQFEEIKNDPEFKEFQKNPSKTYNVPYKRTSTPLNNDSVHHDSLENQTPEKNNTSSLLNICNQKHSIYIINDTQAVLTDKVRTLTMAPKNKGIKVSLLELINETGAKGDFDEATYSSKIFENDEKAGGSRSFNQRKFQSDGQKPDDDVWRQPKSRIGDGAFEKSSRTFQSTDDSGFDRSNLPSRQALLDADKSFRKPSGFKTTKQADDLVSDSVWRVSKPVSKPSSGIYCPPSDYNRSSRPSESNVWRSSFRSEVSEPKASEMFVPKPVPNVVREIKQPSGEPVASALESVLPTQPNRMQSNRFASLLDNSVSSEDEEARNKDLTTSEGQKKPESTTQSTPEAAPHIPEKLETTQPQASSVTPEVTEPDSTEPADEEPFTELDAKKGPKYVPKIKSEKLGAETKPRLGSTSPDKRDQSPRFKLLLESSESRKLYQPRPLADMRNKEFSNKSLDTFIQKKIEKSPATPQPPAEHTTELSTKARYRKLIQEQKAKKLEMEEEEQRQISKKLAQLLETKMMYEDVEKTHRFEEFVKKFLNERRDAEELQQKISQLFLDEDVESLIPSIVLVKAFILEAYDTLISEIDKPLTDLNRMESVRPLALLIKPALLHLFDHSYIEEHPLLLLQVTQRILHAIKFPKVTKGLALIEAIWDALYMTDILSEPTFKKWYADIEDESPGRSSAMFQILPWFEWLNQSAVPNVVNLSEEEEFEEDDEF